MQKISHITITNFKACVSVSLPLEDFTPLVGQNNAGKSTILEALRWLLKPDSRSASDFFNTAEPIIVTAKVEGITPEVLQLVPETKHRTAIEPYCPNGVLWIRTKTEGAKVKQEVWDVENLKQQEPPDAWRTYPTGLPQAVSAILPEPLVISAMKDVQKDFTSVAAGTSIKRLIEEIAEPVTKANAVQIQEALNTINGLLAGRGDGRSEALKEFDSKASTALSDFFPGLSLQLELPETKVKEFFKSGSLKITEQGRDGTIEFSQLGSGAQRSIEMALLCYLAGTASDTETKLARKLLLIDEPELYLHPQSVRRVRRALQTLSKKGFQVIFSTHSPIMLDRESAASTIIVKKDDSSRTETRKPLQDAVQTAIEAGPSQAKVLFELGKLAEIYFADIVVICEGKTDARLLPLAYEKHYGCPPDVHHIAFVSLGGCGDIRKSLAVLQAMRINSCAVVDLDFGFVEATKSSDPLVQPDGEMMQQAKAILERLRGVHGFTLSNGLPKSGNDFSADEVWAMLAKETDGQKLATQVHDHLKGRSIWAWKCGCIEDVTGSTQKGEEAIMQQEADLSVMTKEQVAAAYPSFIDCFAWIQSVK